METAGSPGVLVSMYDHIPAICCHKNLKSHQNHTFYNHLIIRRTHVCCWWWRKVERPSSPLVPLDILIRSGVRVIKMMLLTSPSPLPHATPDLGQAAGLAWTKQPRETQHLQHNTQEHFKLSIIDKHQHVYFFTFKTVLV